MRGPAWQRRRARPARLSGRAGLLDLPPPKLFGRHQFDNAGRAIAALRAAAAAAGAAIEQG
jgi:hypothetical protein